VTSQDALKRSLAAPERLARGDLEVEAREITSTGHVTAYGARSVSPVERYKRRGQLTLRQVRAAEMLYRAWALGIEGARADSPGCSASTPGGLSDAQVQAVRSYEAARIHVGRHLWPLVFAVVCEDWTAERFANDRGRNSTSTLEALRYALDTVGDAFGLPD
jgi:hypothetical protein